MINVLVDCAATAAFVVVVVVVVVVDGVDDGGDDGGCCGGCSFRCILSGRPCVRVRMTFAHILIVVPLKFLNSC